MKGLLDRISACTACSLEHGCRPVVQADPEARVVIVGQAPGSKVHASGVPWQDESGKRLRGWLGLDAATFYGPRVALIPMGFCYPGKGEGGDLPPRRECAPLWHAALLAAMPRLSLRVLAGQYAQAAYLPGRERTLTARVRRWRDHGEHLPIPHPSWRAQLFMRREPWFEAELLPDLRTRVSEAMA